MYKQPEIRSTYKGNNLGRTIYDYIIEKNPFIVFEIGAYLGHSAVCIAQALKDLTGKDQRDRLLYCFDLWNPKKYKQSEREIFQENIVKYEVDDIIIPIQLSLDGALSFVNIKPNVVHIDISNTGDIIRKVYDRKICPNVIFEGGTTERDNIPWMKKEEKIVGSCPYRVLNDNFPGLSEIIYE